MAKRRVSVSPGCAPTPRPTRPPSAGCAAIYDRLIAGRGNEPLVLDIRDVRGTPGVARYELKRAEREVPLVVTHRILEGNVGYIAFNRFRPEAAADFGRALRGAPRYRRPGARPARQSGGQHRGDVVDCAVVLSGIAACAHPASAHQQPGRAGRRLRAASAVGSAGSPDRCQPPRVHAAGGDPDRWLYRQLVGTARDGVAGAARRVDRRPPQLRVRGRRACGRIPTARGRRAIRGGVRDSSRRWAIGWRAPGCARIAKCR